MKRALALAALGTKKVKDNPKVGAVLVHNDNIIGEGYHMVYGQGHAEVNCINSVKETDINLIADSKIYITLEPCFHEGKTPPCVDLILKNKIREVIIGTTDPNPKVGGKSIEKLKSHGIKVTVGILEEECKKMIRPFVKMMLQKMPWVLLKFAKSRHNYLATENSQIWLSTPHSKLYAHHLRTNIDGILIGTNTALIDNPSLTTRLVEGEHPIRIVLDRTGKLPNHLTLFTDLLPTIYVTSQERILPDNVKVIIHNFEQDESLSNLLKTLYQNNIYKLMVEGGGELLSSIHKDKLWDEAIVIHTNHYLNKGKKAPNLEGKLTKKIELDEDIIHLIER